MVPSFSRWTTERGSVTVILACVAAGPRTRLNPLYTEGLERLRRRLSDMGIPVFWVSPVTLTQTQIAKVIWEGDANVTRVLGMGMP